MVRQRQRLEQVRQIIETDKGVDPQINEEITLLPDVVEIDNYAEAVNKVCAGAIGKGIDVAIVDGCLRILAVKSEHIRATDIGLVYHCFFHMATPGQPCLLNDSLRKQGGLAAMRKIPPFVDFIQNNLTATWGTPLYLWLKPEYIFEVLTGRIRVFAQFDLTKFFEIAASHGIHLTWVTTGADSRVDRLTQVIPGSPNAGAASVRFGDKGGEQLLLGGFFARVLGDVTTPVQLIELIKRYPEQKKKMDKNLSP